MNRIEVSDSLGPWGTSNVNSVIRSAFTYALEVLIKSTSALPHSISSKSKLRLRVRWGFQKDAGEVFFTGGKRWMWRSRSSGAAGRSQKGQIAALEQQFAGGGDLFTGLSACAAAWRAARGEKMNGVGVVLRARRRMIGRTEFLRPVAFGCHERPERASRRGW